jgi:hypothetical protein
MTHDLTIDGLLYISSKRASELTGYTQDYIGQLARTGKVIARRVGGLWYVLQESISGHKLAADAYVPVPPPPSARTDDESPFVAFDGKTYISATQASDITSYNPDYIGQLAREGKILSRRVGTRWYVDIDGLKAHKNEKDSLLRAVQAESVGIWRPEANSHSESKEAETSGANNSQHFNYVAESHPLMPILQKVRTARPEEQPFEQSEVEPELLEEAHTIPIRVIHTPTMREIAIPMQSSFSNEKVPRKALMAVRLPGKAIFIKGFMAIGILVLIAIAYNMRIIDVASYFGNTYGGDEQQRSEVVREQSLKGTVQRMFSRSVEFQRGR